MAIASLVLSIVWLGGLGSLLAVILGFTARSEIKRSNGTRSGDGLALAGIIIGFLGMCGVALLVVLSLALGTAVNGVNQELQPTTVTYGTTVDVSGGLNPGIQNLTVYSLTFPVQARGSGIPPAGRVLAVAQMRVCAGSNGSQIGFFSVALSVYFADGQTGSLDSAVSVDGRGRNLSNLGNLAPNQCVSGYVPFDVGRGTHPIGVQYTAAFFRTINWTD